MKLNIKFNYNENYVFIIINKMKGEIKIMEENFGGEELDNIVILNDEEGNEVKFEFLDLVELDDEEYVVLLPVTEEGE